MEEDANQLTIKSITCSYCKMHINSEIFQFHSIRCKNRLPNYQSKQSHQLQRPASRISTIKQKQNPRIQQTHIFCVKCGSKVYLHQIQKHDEQCEGREQKCDFCNIQYPTFLMQDHHNICEKKKFMQSRRRFRFEDEFPRMIPRRFSHIQSSSQELTQQQDDFQPRYRFRYHESRPRSPMRFSVSFFNQLLSQQESNSGLNKKQIQNIKKINYEMKQERDTCTICCTQFDDEEKISQLKCQHNFHIECISKWLIKSTKCPNCKNDEKKRR